MWSITKSVSKQWNPTTQKQGWQRFKMDEKKGMALIFSFLTVITVCGTFYLFFIIQSGNSSRVARLEKSLAQAQAEVRLGTACLWGDRTK